MADNQVLEEEYDPDYIPTQDEVDEYAEFLGGLEGSATLGVEAVQDRRRRHLLFQLWFRRKSVGASLRQILQKALQDGKGKAAAAAIDDEERK